MQSIVIILEYSRFAVTIFSAETIICLMQSHLPFCPGIEKNAFCSHQMFGIIMQRQFWSFFRINFYIFFFGGGGVVIKSQNKVGNLHLGAPLHLSSLGELYSRSDSKVTKRGTCPPPSKEVHHKSLKPAWESLPSSLSFKGFFDSPEVCAHCVAMAALRFHNPHCHSCISAKA